MQQEYLATLIGAAPLLMHNGQTADQANRYARMKKAVSSKRNKTDADYDELKRIDWYSGLYLLDGRLCLPGRVLEACLVNGAKSRKKGKMAQAGMFVPDDMLVVYEGPDDMEELYEDEELRERYSLSVPVTINRVKVVSTRPVFFPWQVETKILYNDELLNPEDIMDFLDIAGRQVGVGDWRPRYGRFNVEHHTSVAAAPQSKVSKKAA